MNYLETTDYYQALGKKASRFSKLSGSLNVSRKENRTDAYVLTFQNNEEGNRLCDAFKKNNKPTKGSYYQKQGRHSDRKGLADRGLAYREWTNGTPHVRNVSVKHSEYYDIYIRLK